MANVLIVYATREGQTAKIASRIADVLRARGHATTLVLASTGRALDLSPFDRVCIGSPMHMKKYAPEIVSFIEKNRATLAAKDAAFFSVNLAIRSSTSDGRAQTQAVAEELFSRTGWHPNRCELFAGALRYSKYNFLVRIMMRMISKREGGDTDTSRDYEYTDWAQVERFADSLVTSNAKAA